MDSTRGVSIHGCLSLFDSVVRLPIIHSVELSMSARRLKENRRMPLQLQQKGRKTSGIDISDSSPLLVRQGRLELKKKVAL